MSVYIMPVSEIEARTTKLIAVKESIIENQIKLEGYAERIEELLDWAESECDVLAKHIALQTIEKIIVLRNKIDKIGYLDK